MNFQIKSFLSLRLLRAIFILCFWLFQFVTFAQSSIRKEIEDDFRYLNYEDEKTLEKARGFIRADSTYYIGYMCSGGFKYFRANDKLGFGLAITDLEKAMYLIEKDFDAQLRTRTSDIYKYLSVNQYHNDYCELAFWLEKSYQNIENPQKSYETLLRVRDRNFQIEKGLESLNSLAWIYHRNRMYTSKLFPFLKNTVEENVSMAYKYLDSSLIKLKRDGDLNAGLFANSFIDQQYLYTYHYKAILFDYSLEIDSANFYYDELIRSGYYSSNNYAEFKLVLGEFDEADKYFHEAEDRDGSREKQTREYFYMRGTLDVYRGHPEDADTLLKKVVDQTQGTPGYGWHSIALARALRYEGLTSESQSRVNRASSFDELHIGTTWGQEQYSNAVATLNYVNGHQFKQDFFFENDEWYFWCNPVNWYKYINYSFKINNDKLLLAALLAGNPERKNVIYPLFASENLINFDETVNVIEGFGNKYFIDIYKNFIQNDKRPKIKKYFRYALGKFYLAEGNEEEAIRYFEEVLADPEIDDPYQKLLLARTYEGMALASSKKSVKRYWTIKMYETFPQLVPPTNLQMEFRLVGDVEGTGSHVIGILALIFGLMGLLFSFILYQLKKVGRINVRSVVVYLPLFGMTISSIIFSVVAANIGAGKPRQRIIEDLKNCNLVFTNAQDVPVVEFESSELNDRIIIDYVVRNAGGINILSVGTLVVPVDEIQDGGKLFAYRLFGIKKAKIGEEPESVQLTKSTEKNKK